MTGDVTGGGLPQGLRAALARAAQARHLLVTMDFDGTMSPLVPRAEDARPLPAAAAAFAALSGLHGTTTALVSGRALASLRMVASPPEQALLVGSHGAEVWLGTGSTAPELDEAQSAALRRAVSCVEAAVRANAGTTAEHKPAGVVLHYRQATAEAAAAAVGQVLAELAEDPALFITEGKMVLEISAVDANKGESLALLRAKTGATAVVFVGDDVTDEHGFAVLGPGDVGVKVGPGDTAAPFRVASPLAVADVLELLAADRADWLRENRA